MRTRTIFKAMGKAIDEARWRYMPGELERRKRLRRMADTFKAELLRRMDERDALAAKAKAWDALQKWKALDTAGFCSYYDLSKAKDAADAAASEVA